MKRNHNKYIRRCYGNLIIYSFEKNFVSIKFNMVNKSKSRHHCGTRDKSKKKRQKLNALKARIKIITRYFYILIDWGRYFEIGTRTKGFTQSPLKFRPSVPHWYS